MNIVLFSGLLWAFSSLVGADAFNGELPIPSSSLGRNANNGTYPNLPKQTWAQKAYSLAGIAAERVIDGEQVPRVEKMSTFSSWINNTVTSIGVQYPRTDADLRNILAYAKVSGIRISIVGAGHSAFGLVTTGELGSTSELVISLAEYTPDAPRINTTKCSNRWDQICIREDAFDPATLTSRARSPAGRSFADLYNVIRPRHFFLPTQTAGWFFSQAGVALNAVHGGVYDADFLNRYCVGMRVMYFDGTVEIINKEDDLRYWRGSMGLLGIVTALEWKIELRRTFIEQAANYKLVDTASPNQGEFAWTKEGIDTLVQHERDRAFYGEFFLDFAYGGFPIDVTVVNFRRPENVTKDEKDVDCGQPSTATIMKGYTDIKSEFHQIEYQGDPTTSAFRSFLTKKINIANSIIPAALLSQAVMKATSLLVANNRATTNDGYWVRSAMPTYIMEYIFPAKYLFQALDSYRVAATSQKHRDVYLAPRVNLPLEFRFISVQDKGPMLFNLPTGKYVTLEALFAVGKEEYSADGERKHGVAKQLVWKFFSEVEALWKKIGIPHPAKVFGFDLKMYPNSGKVSPSCGKCTDPSHYGKACRPSSEVKFANTTGPVFRLCCEGGWSYSEDISGCMMPWNHKYLYRGNKSMSASPITPQDDLRNFVKYMNKSDPHGMFRRKGPSYFLQM